MHTLTMLGSGGHTTFLSSDFGKKKIKSGKNLTINSAQSDTEHIEAV